MPGRKPADSFGARWHQAVVDAGYTFVLERHTGSPQRLRNEDDDRGSSVSYLSVLDLDELRRTFGLPYNFIGYPDNSMPAST